MKDMQPITVVTSCSAAGWREYGARFVRSFLEHWPVEVGLHLVSEDDLPLDRALLERVRFRRLHESSKAREFEDRHRDNLRAHGRVERPGDVGWKPKKRVAGYNFRYDASKFCKKVFAIDLIAPNVTTGRLFWIDADAVTFRAMDLGLLERVLPDTCALSCLDRGTYHSECGFIGYNLDFAAPGAPPTAPKPARAFIAAFADLYASDRVFELQEWHDSWVFDWLRREMRIATHAIPHESRKHPFVNSELGFYMDHMKGARKDKSRTPSEQVVSSRKRALPYWSRMPA